MGRRERGIQSAKVHTNAIDEVKKHPFDTQEKENPVLLSRNRVLPSGCPCGLSVNYFTPFQPYLPILKYSKPMRFISLGLY